MVSPSHLFSDPSPYGASAGPSLARLYIEQLTAKVVSEPVPSRQRSHVSQEDTPVSRQNPNGGTDGLVHRELTYPNDEY